MRLRRPLLALAATLIAFTGAATTANAADDTNHTATSCSGHSTHGLCLISGSQNAWDPAHESNRTLTRWFYPGGQTLIASSIDRIVLYPTRCKVEFYTDENFTGQHFLVQGSATAALSKPLSAPFLNHTLSFQWFCPAA